MNLYCKNKQNKICKENIIFKNIILIICLFIVKLAIASGKTYFTSIGDPKTMSYYVITGKPVWDVKFLEGLCRYINNIYTMYLVLNISL